MGWFKRTPRHEHDWEPWELNNGTRTTERGVKIPVTLQIRRCKDQDCRYSEFEELGKS